MQQIVGTLQCFDMSLNAYLDKCLEIIALFDGPIDENTMANNLAQQALGF
jgi:small nuclear ribonucleoprotein (snRNP)-like protein